MKLAKLECHSLNKQICDVISAVIDVVAQAPLATFRLEYEDQCEYEFSEQSTRFRFGGRKLSKCACSELKTRIRSRPRTPI